MALGGTCPLEPNKSCSLARGAESGACARPQQRRGRGAHLGVQDPAVPQPSASLPLKMPRTSQPLSLLVLLVLAATAQGQAGAGPKELQPWLISLTAVVVFLFIVFVLLLINRLWQIRMRRWASAVGTHPAPASAAGTAGPGGSRVLRGGDGDVPRHRSTPLSPRRKQGGLQETQGTDRLEHAGCANPAAEKDSDGESDSEEQSTATSL
ncbi:small integral membrane protein 24 isoform 1-T1 [Morphnus guianensis]